MNASEIRRGIVINYNGAPHRVLEFQHRTPGNLRAFVQARIRNLLTGLATEVRFSSTESVERVSLEQHKMQYLYKEGDEYHFMNTEDYEQITLDAEALGDNVYYLIDGTEIEVETYEGKPIGITPAPIIELRVIETPPEMRGATAANSPKPATLETGLVVNVPAFVKQGEKIRIDTTTGQYLERVR
ncbi:MAG TPA: elongation factor P [Candidatus Limnocylindrales bacterium]|nr:elongation factor P [Candidatus Limnocylindrales bacterium]